ncbi:unnamed protein product [Pedinophyceae sp. YPF-701]|nr:unnamed protein product [Pedinophyceae sp. YPF-701]
MGSMRDPFYLVKEEIQDTLDQVEQAFRKWQQIPPSTPDQDRVGRDIEDGCGSVIWQVDELDNAVDVAERDPARFGLAKDEIQRRRDWTSKSRRRAQHMQRRVQDARRGATARGPVPGGAVEMSQMSNKGAPGGVAGNGHKADPFVDEERQQQQLLLRDQDEQLDGLSVQVGRIGEMGLAIGNELQEQSLMLEDLAADTDTTSSRLKATQRKIAEIMKKASMKSQFCMMGILLLLFIVLTMLVFA